MQSDADARLNPMFRTKVQRLGATELGTVLSQEELPGEETWQSLRQRLLELLSDHEKLMQQVTALKRVRRGLACRRCALCAGVSPAFVPGLSLLQDQQTHAAAGGRGTSSADATMRMMRHLPAKKSFKPVEVPLPESVQSRATGAGSGTGAAAPSPTRKAFNTPSPCVSVKRCMVLSRAFPFH